MLKHIYNSIMSDKLFEISFTELRCKDVINAADGRRLGKITDLVFSGETGKIKGIVVPYLKRSVFSKNQEIFIPWRCVGKLGEDVIIVDVGSVENGVAECKPDYDPEQKPPPKPPKKPGAPRPGVPQSCDGNCDKCMLFDCEYRWKGNR